MTFNVHLAQFDVSPTRNLIIETIPLKSIEHCILNNLTNIHVMTFTVHLAQFDVAPSRTRAGISLIWTQDV